MLKKFDNWLRRQVAVMSERYYYSCLIWLLIVGVACFLIAYHERPRYSFSYENSFTDSPFTEINGVILVADMYFTLLVFIIVLIINNIGILSRFSKVRDHKITLAGRMNVMLLLFVIPQILFLGFRMYSNGLFRLEIFLIIAAIYYISYILNTLIIIVTSSIVSRGKSLIVFVVVALSCGALSASFVWPGILCRIISFIASLDNAGSLGVYEFLRSYSFYGIMMNRVIFEEKVIEGARLNIDGLRFIPPGDVTIYLASLFIIVSILMLIYFKSGRVSECIENLASMGSER